MLNIEKFRNELSKDLDALDCQICALRKKGNCNCNCEDYCDECRTENIKWLCSEYKKPILTEEENEYLSSVIKPFRDRVNSIYKTRTEFKERIVIIAITDGVLERVDLPTFENGSIFKGMKPFEYYKLEELGL